MIDGRTTITDAAIISPQSSISEPLSERRATATVIFPVLLIKNQGIQEFIPSIDKCINSCCYNTWCYNR